MKNNSIHFAFLTILVISLVIASTPVINQNTPPSATSSLNSKTNGQGDLITVPESTNPVTVDGDITASEWSDAYNITLTLDNETHYWDVQFWIKYNDSHILMAENVSNPAVNPYSVFMFMVGIFTDLFMIHGQDIKGVAGNNFTGTYTTIDMFQPSAQQDPEYDTILGGTNDTIGETHYDSSEGPSAEWIQHRYIYDSNIDFYLGTGLLFFLKFGYNDGYQPEDDPIRVEDKDILMFTLEGATVPYSTTPVDFDGNIDLTVEWKDALPAKIELFNSTYSWTGYMWVKFNYTHLLVAMNVTDPMTYGNFSFYGLFENLLDFNTSDFSSDLFGILGDNANTLTETQDQYLSGHPSDLDFLKIDTVYGGTNDTYGVTYYDMDGPRAEFCHPLNSGDPYDEAIQAGSTILGMAGYGDGLWNAYQSGPFGVSFSAALVLEEPVIDSPDDITYEEGSTGHSITWHPRALNYHMYNVTEASTVLESDVWDGGDITIDVDGLGVGAHTFTCSVNSTYGTSISDSVTVVVTEDTTPPTINSPSDITYEEGETGYSITWQPRDTNPHKYNVTRNGTVVESGDWDGGDITIEVDGLSVGTYIFVCGVNDTNGRSTSDEVTVTVTEPEEVSEFQYGYTFIALIILPLIALIAYRKTRKLKV